MVLISVPKPPKDAYDPDRPMSSLLRAQIDHLREAESKLPLRYRSDRYIRAIKTEGEAARYIRDVTQAIHLAHEDAERERHAPKRKRKLEIAAAADERGERKAARPRTRRVAARKKSSGAKARKT